MSVTLAFRAQPPKLPDAGLATRSRWMQSFRITRITAVAIVVLGPAVMLNAKPEDAQDLIKVGAPLPLTGPLSPEGLKQKRVYDLWADAANSKGGIRADGKTYRVEIVY